MSDVTFRIPSSGTLNFTPDALVVTPPAPPIPVSSLQFQPTKLENFTVLSPGLYRSNAGALAPGKSSVCALHYDLRGKSNYGKTVHLRYKRTGNYPQRGNLKILRAWNASEPGRELFYPDLYIGCPKAEDVKNYGWLTYSEDLEPVNGRTRFYVNPWPCGDGVKHLDEFFFKLPSGIGAADGALQFYCDGKAFLSTTSWQMNSAARPGILDWFCIQDNLSNDTWPAGSSVIIEDPQVTVL